VIMNVVCTISGWRNIGWKSQVFIPIRIRHVECGPIGNSLRHET